MTKNLLENFKSIYKLDNVNLEGGNRVKKETYDQSKPLITIITATFNSEKYLEECFLSLHNQKFSDYEHIIIDGNSTDKTINIIKKYESKLLTGVHHKIRAFMMLLTKVCNWLEENILVF